MSAPLALPALYTAAIPPLPFDFSQPRRGYRFGVENLALAALLDARPRPDAIVDLGAGSGILGLLARHLFARPTDGPPCWVPTWLVERQPVHAALCRHHAALDSAATHDDGVHVLEGDLCDLPISNLLPPAQRRLVLLNPPFFAPGQGRESSEETTRLATHAHHGGLDAFVAAAASCVERAGEVALIWPAEAVAEALLALQDHGLAPRRILWVYARHTGRPHRVWILACHDPGPLQQWRCSAWTQH